MAIAEQQAATGEVDRYLRHFDSMQAERRYYEPLWQLAADYILFRQDMSVVQRPNVLRPRRVTSNVAPNANDRLASFLLAYSWDPTRPNFLPNVKRGLAIAGRPADLDDASMDYLGDVATQIDDHMNLPKAMLEATLDAGLKEYCCFGNMVTWIGHRRGFGPIYQSRPIRACWWSVNEEGVIDTLYFKLMLPVYRVLERWPAAAQVKGWDTDKARDEQQVTSIVLACEPRQGGVQGSVAQNKPFAYVVIAEEKKAILERSGYDSFPYGVACYDRQSGQTYSYGIGVKALPDIMVLNRLMQMQEAAIEMIVDPPLAAPARLFGQSLDRRPGALNTYNATGLGLQRADQAIWKLDIAGDPKVSADYIQYLTSNIELAYFTDWMRLRDSGDMTAAEVNDRRDMRLRGTSSIVATMNPMWGSIAERSFEILVREDLIAPPPPQLSKVEVDWEYAGPLRIAQLRGQVQSALQLMQARGLAAQQDQGAAHAVDLEECLRVVNDGLGLPPRVMNSREKVKAFVAQMNARQQQQEDAAKLAQVAAAAKDGTAAAGNAVGAANDMAGGPMAGGGPPGGGGGAPFAPAAPLSAPVIGAAA